MCFMRGDAVGLGVIYLVERELGIESVDELLPRS